MFQARLAECAGRVADCLDTALREFDDQPLAAAMRHAVRGGKRFRAFLVMESARLHWVDDANSVWAAAAVEAVHAYSLVHDDLPCMDDDDLRRGQPTVHVKWDEATAVLVGDALQAWAFGLLSREELSADPQVRLALVASMARAAGPRGMVLGQAQDIAAESAEAALSLEQITDMQANKTGALIAWSAQAGAVLAGAEATAMRRYADALGLAFQIADDILDVQGDVDLAGKRVGKDAQAGKATFVSLLGLDGAKARARALASEAESVLEPYGDAAQTLREAARFVISREM